MCTGLGVYCWFVVLPKRSQNKLARQIKLSLFTPEKPFLKEQAVQEILAPSVKGFLGILPGHAPLVTLLKAGVLKYLPQGKSTWEKLALGWGYLEVHQDHVRILAESAKTKESLDRAQSQKELEAVLKQLKSWDIEPLEREKLEKKKLCLEGELAL